MGIDINRLLEPARSRYKSSPAIARRVNRILWTITGARSVIPLFERVQPYTLVGGWGLLALYRLCTEVKRRGIDGSFVECGVYRGGCGGLMAALADGRHTWLFDSFEGLPEPSAEDQGHALAMAGRFAAPEAEARRLLFDELRLDPAKISIEKGWFDRTLPEARLRMGPIAVLRLDADLYESTRCCLENLYDLVEPGGYIILDDYYGWPGCRKAVDEFLAQRGARVRMHQVDPLDREKRLSAVYFERPQDGAAS